MAVAGEPATMTAVIQNERDFLDNSGPSIVFVPDSAHVQVLRAAGIVVV